MRSNRATRAVSGLACRAVARAVAAALAAGALALLLPVLAGADTRLVGSGPLTVSLPPGATVEKSMRPAVRGPLGTVAVWVRVTEARARDLTLTLVAPDGRARVLSARHGGAGAGLGSGGPGCKGGSLIFSDDGFQTLDRAAYPYAGWVRPDEPLRALRGIEAGGRWTLRIANAAGGVAGALTCWRLELGLDVDTTVTARGVGRGGTVTASVTFRELNQQYSRIRVHVAGAGATLDVPFAKVKCASCAADGPNLLAGGHPLTVRDLDGDGVPEVLLDTYTGGAHCCSVSVIFRRAGTSWAHSAVWWGNPGYRLEDLDRDGRPELVTADDAFGYLFTSWAASGEPLVVYRYAQGRLLDVTRDFPAQLRADAASYWKGAQEQLAQKGGEARGLLAAWAADMANLGKADEAFATLARLAAQGKLGDDEHMGTPAGTAYVAALRSFLRKQRYPVEADGTSGPTTRPGGPQAAPPAAPAPASLAGPRPVQRGRRSGSRVRRRG